MEENWLKFYVNPFANLLDVEKVRHGWTSLKAGNGMLLQAVVMRWTASSWSAMAWAGVDSLCSLIPSYNASDGALGVCHV